MGEWGRQNQSPIPGPFKSTVLESEGSKYVCCECWNFQIHSHHIRIQVSRNSIAPVLSDMGSEDWKGPGSAIGRGGVGEWRGGRDPDTHLEVCYTYIQ